MAQIALSIEADLCGPVSVGTVQVIRALHECLELPLADAVAYVNRCVFDAERVLIPAPSLAAAERFARQARRRPTPAKLRLTIVP